MLADNLNRIKKEVPLFDREFDLLEDNFAETVRDPARASINRTFKQYDRRIRELISELIRQEPDKTQQWNRVGQNMDLESFRRMLALIKKSHEPMTKAARATIDYVERNRLITR